VNPLRLTIGVPTWNRAGVIGEALDSVLAQLADAKRDRVEILVADNASTDETSAVVRRLSDSHPGWIRYHRHEQNLDFAGNIDAIMRLARGTHVLFLGDDDALAPGAIQQVLLALDEHPGVGVAFLGISAYEDAPAERSGAPAPEPPGAAQGTPAWRYFESGVAFFRARGTLCSACISGCVFSRDAWARHDSGQSLRSISPHMFAAIQILSRGGVLLIERPLVRYRTGRAADQERYEATRCAGIRGWPFVYHFDLVRGCQWIKQHYPADVHRAFYRASLRGVLTTLWMVKVRGRPVDHEWFDTQLATCCDPDVDRWAPWLIRSLTHWPGWLFWVPFGAYRAVLWVRRKAARD
jgi:glycosyltransferase involved in cell wall biosynthesis